MNRVVCLTLAAGAAALVCACTSESPQQPLSEPLRASFSDGAHSGNPDFFFLPPLFKSPTNNPNFSPGQFNAALQPTVEICELAALVPPATIRPCGATIETFAGSAVGRDVSEQQYHVNWKTSESNLLLNREYRIRVLLGTQELGYADVDPVANGSQLKNVATGEYIGLVDGRTLPIKFRIENGAACFGGACDSKTIALAQGGFVVLTETGDRIDIPAQQSGQTVTVTVEQCENLDVDLPVFGNCVRVIADPPLAARLFPAATVSFCSLDPLLLPLSHEQSELLTVHRQDDELVVALPHSEDFCQAQIGRRDKTPSTFASRGWRAVRNVAAWVFKPTTLHATTMVLDVGAGGQTDGFSDFQLALPAKMGIVSLADQTASPNSTVASVPEVVVTDADGQPVANARVHFQITSTGGGSITPLVVLSNADGHAGLTLWTVGAVGRHIVQASGKGIADPKNNGPAAGFDPFAPAVLHDPDDDEAQPPVTLGTGHLAFTAEALAGSQLDQQNLLDGSLGGQGIGRFNDIDGTPDPNGTSFDFQDAQTFTAGTSGRLAQIKVPLVNTQEATAGVTMEIVAVNADGFPDETHSLGEVTIPVSAITTNFDDIFNPAAWATFDLTSLQIDVTSGQALAFIVRSLSTKSFLYNPEFSSGYANGRGFRRNRALTTAWINNENDFGFQTFVIPN